MTDHSGKPLISTMSEYGACPTLGLPVATSK